jgi:hypothetical protein
MTHMTKQLPSSSNHVTKKELELLHYVHSMGVVSEDLLGHADIHKLLERDWIHKVWIGNYALTETGKRVRRDELGS